MTIFLIILNVKEEPRLGFNNFTTSMHFLLRCFVLFNSFKTICSIINTTLCCTLLLHNMLNFYWLCLCYSCWCKSHFLLPRCDESNSNSWFGYCTYPSKASCAWNFDNSFKPSWTTSFDIYLHDDVALVIFDPKDWKWTKELSSRLYFLNYNFKVGHEPWTCVNPHCLANPRNQKKKQLVSHIFILIIHVVCVHYYFISLLFYSFTFVVQTVKFIGSYLLAFSIILMDWNTCLCLCKWMSTNTFQKMIGLMWWSWW